MSEDDFSDKPDGEKPWWAEAVREITAVGLGTVFMTEEAVRGYLKDKKLPKDVVSALLDSVSKKKDDFSRILSREVTKAVSSLDMSKEMRRFLETHDVHVEAKLSFSPKSKESSDED